MYNQLTNEQLSNTIETALALATIAMANGEAEEMYHSEDWSKCRNAVWSTAWQYEFDKIEETLVKALRMAHEDIEPVVSDKIEKGAIVYSSWGYDQTNVDFFVVVRRTKKTAWYVPISATHEADSMLTGKDTAGKTVLWEKGIEGRRIYIYNGKEQGINGSESFNNVRLWDGRAKYSSSTH
jgi:hypothetical protein